MLRRLHRAIRPGLPEARDGAALEIVPMRRRHVRQVVAIEERIFPRPWSPALYLSELASPASRAYLVALVDGAVVGYTGSMLVAGEGHVTTIGVAPEWQRRGIGIKLLYRLVCELRDRGAKALTLEVRMSNTGAQILYRRFGFVPAGVRKNYYPEVNEDGLVMWAYDVDTRSYLERLAEISRQIGLPPPGADGVPGGGP
jgi:ribosomal-protein-alanine N-acetyltransferase